MSSLPLSTSHSPFLPVGFEDKKAALLRHIAGSERLTAVRPASRLEVRLSPEMLSTGIAEVDAITGGLPRGCLTEICGSASSGKTSLLMATLAAATPPRVKSSERNLEQVLKTTDLILQSGGFGLVVLDLAGIPEQFARRIPLASWFRFQRVIEPAKTALVVVSESPRTQSCAGLVIKLCSKPSAVNYQPSATPSHAQILEGMRLHVEIARSRLERRPMQSVTAVFKTQAVRAG